MIAIQKWIKGFFNPPKREKISDATLSQMMFSSVLGILICGISLAGMTWAWFSSSITSNSNSITTANFEVEITVKPQSGDHTPLSATEVNGKYTYTLSGDTTEYKVIIKALGSAEKNGGYCSVTYLRETPYHTVQLFPGSNENKIHEITFTVTAAGSSSLVIVPQWGTYAKPDDEVLIGKSEGDISVLPIPSVSLLVAESEKAAETAVISEIADVAETEELKETQTNDLTESEQSYTVQKGDTLSKIAKSYGTTVAVLSAYNNIADVDKIKAGAIIKIPPVSYTISETASDQSATA